MSKSNSTPRPEDDLRRLHDIASELESMHATPGRTASGRQAGAAVSDAKTRVSSAEAWRVEAESSELECRRLHQACR